jgi:hypothetical protein
MRSITKRITQGLALVPMLALLAGAVVPVQTAYAGADCQVSDGIDSAACARGEGQSEDLTSETGVFRTVTNILLFIIGAVSVIMLVIGGVRYTISGGDSTQVTAAKNTILYAIIGIVVAILAYAAVDFVISAFVDA